MRNNYADCAAEPRLVHEAKAASTDSVITVAADDEQFWVLDWIALSYGGEPSSGSIKVEIGGDTVFEHAIASAGTTFINFQGNPLYREKLGESMVITLAHGGQANKLSVRYR